MTSDIDKALPYYLTHQSGLTSIVSTRIFPMRIPQGETLPAIFFQDISTSFIQAHNEPSFLPRKRYQFTSVGGTVEDAEKASHALKLVLDGLHKTNIGVSPYTTEVEAIIIKDERKTDDPETGLFWCQQDFLVIYKE